MTAPPSLSPMSTFDPSKPAMLYDELNDKLFEWNPANLGSWHRYARVHDKENCVMEWDGLLLTGWEEIGGDAADNEVRMR